MNEWADKIIIQKQESAQLRSSEGRTGEIPMAPSIPSNSVVQAENQNRNVSEFSQSLEKLSQGLRQSGQGARPASYGEQFDQRVKAAELAKNVRNVSEAVTEARTASDGLQKVGELLGEARGLAFGAINEPGRRLGNEDLARFSGVVQKMERLSEKVVFGGGPLLEGSRNFGRGGELGKLDLSNFEGSLGAIQVIDRALSEVGDQRGLLGVFQSSKLADIGRLLRGGLGGVVSTKSVVVDRVVAVEEAEGLGVKILQAKESSLLSSGNAAGQILASIVGRES